MSTCTFFGHRQSPPALRPQLRSVLIDLIEGQGVHTFYVGNQGDFDHMVYSVLDERCQEYPGITYGIVLAYLPTEQPNLPTRPKRWERGWSISTLPMGRHRT